MKRMNLWAGLVSLFVLGAWVVQAQENVQAQAVKESKDDIVPQPANTTQSQSQTKVIPQGSVNGSQLCSFCFTCGGAYPIFSGGFRSVGDTPTERGASCADPLQLGSDSFPFLCCAF